MKGNLGDVVGGWAFLIGVILSLIVGLFAVSSPTVTIVLVVLGLLVGLLNVGVKEVNSFLMSGLVLVLLGYVGADKLMSVVPYVGGILTALMTVFIPATVVVAVKNVLILAKR